MRSGIVIVRKILISLLVFIIGFITCIGAIAGGVYFGYSKITYNDFKDAGLIKNDPLDKILVDGAAVSIKDLTLSEFFKEYKDFKELGDEGTIGLLIDKLGFKIPSGLEYVFHNENIREIPFFKLFTEDGKTSVLRAITIGDVLHYEKVTNPDYAPDNGQKEFLWMDGDKEVTGINGFIADYTLFKLIDQGIDTESLSNQVTIAELLGLTSRDYYDIFIDEEGTLVEVTDLDFIKVWYDSEGNLADKVMAAVADTNFAHVGERINEIYMSDVLGYVEYNGNFYNWSVVHGDTEHIVLTLEDGLTSEFSDLTISEISSGGLDDKISDIELYKVLDYKLGDDGRYYDKDNNQVKGVLAAVADEKVGNIGDTVGTVKVGEVAGYTYAEGKWYSIYNSEDPSLNVEAKGMLATMSDLTVDDMTDEARLSDKVQTIPVSDILGYEYDEEKECYMKNDAPVTGVMSVIAGTPINKIEGKIDESEMGDILGFTQKAVPVYSEDGHTVIGMKNQWFDENDQPVHVLMQKVSDTKFNEIGTITDELALSDLIEEDQRKTGFIALVPEDTKLDDISNVVGDIFNTKTLGDFIACGAIVFEDSTDANVLISKGFADFTIPQLLSFIVNSPITAPTNP